jgi:hypothetical protein
MISSEDRLHVLEMIRAGNVTAEEGVKLLEALENRERKPNPVNISSHEGKQSSPRWMRIIISDLDTGKEKINIRLPVNVVGAGFKMGAKFSPDINGYDAISIMQALESGETGKVIDVCNNDSCERIEINLEP